MLRHELESRGVVPSHVTAAAQHTGASQAPPPALGHGPSNLFGGIMANQPGSGSALAPPPPDQQPSGYPPGAAVNGMCLCFRGHVSLANAHRFSNPQAMDPRRRPRHPPAPGKAAVARRRRRPNRRTSWPIPILARRRRWLVPRRPGNLSSARSVSATCWRT